MLTLLLTVVFKLEGTVKIRQNAVHSGITSTPLRHNVVRESYSRQDSNPVGILHIFNEVEHVPCYLFNFLRSLSMGPEK